ncbi:hypothetical protein YPPY25_2161, partial [Yersinia pestis PY-25]
MSLLLLLVN